MKPTKTISGSRVFFKRKGHSTLRDYWCARWDNLELRRILSLPYEPKFHVTAEHLDGYYVELRGIPFVWYRGLFSIGRHLASGRYYRDPVHLPIRGLGEHGHGK